LGSSVDLRKVAGISLDLIPGVAVLAGAKEQNSVLVYRSCVFHGPIMDVDLSLTN